MTTLVCERKGNGILNMDVIAQKDLSVGFASEHYSYTPLFNQKQVKARLRVVNTSGDEWDIGESSTSLLNFRLINDENPELLDQIKYCFAHFLKDKAPGHVEGIFRTVIKFLNSTDGFEGEFGGDLADSLTSEILYFFANERSRSGNGEDHLARVRQWYVASTKLKLPLFSESVSSALQELKLKGRVKGLDVLVQMPGRGPLNSNQLHQLRTLLQRHSHTFKVGDAGYWKLAAVWVYITLGVRPIQLQRMMVCDLAVNLDRDTNRKTYLLNVPSAKKRNAAPRSKFRSRNIPAFLGEMLESLARYNCDWLKANDLKCVKDQTPIFMPTSGLNLRKKGSRLNTFYHAFSADSIKQACKNLIELLNKHELKAGREPLDFKVNARRLRKTFATHAAAIGTPAMMLMELLDHEDMQHVMVYYKLGANFANKIDKVYREELGTILDYFKGEITLEELSEANRTQQVFGPEGLRRLVGIGLCAKNGRCHLAPPYSCYTCHKFEACSDSQVHKEVLGVMIEEVNLLFENEVAPAKYEIDHINGCKSLISQLESCQ